MTLRVRGSFSDLGPKGPPEDLLKAGACAVSAVRVMVGGGTLEVLVATKVLDLQFSVLKLGLFHLDRSRYRFRSALQRNVDELIHAGTPPSRRQEWQCESSARSFELDAHNLFRELPEVIP